MSSGFQQFMCLGNLGNDPEYTVMPSGDGHLKLRMAVTKQWRTKDGEKKEDTQWFNINVWGKQGEALSKILTKGEKILVIGELRTRVVENDNGDKRYFTEVHSDNIKLLGGKRDGGGKGKPDVDSDATDGNPF